MHDNLSADKSEWYLINQDFVLNETCQDTECSPVSYELRLSTIGGELRGPDMTEGTSEVTYTGNKVFMNTIFQELLLQPYCDSKGTKVTYVMDLKASMTGNGTYSVILDPHGKLHDLSEMTEQPLALYYASHQLSAFTD